RVLTPFRNSFPVQETPVMKYLTAIPVYNEEHHLEGVLREVRRYSPDILVVNDGSTDRTGEFLARQDNLRIIAHPQNLGYGAGLGHAAAAMGAGGPRGSAHQGGGRAARLPRSEPGLRRRPGPGRRTPGLLSPGHCCGGGRGAAEPGSAGRSSYPRRLSFCVCL